MSAPSKPWEAPNQLYNQRANMSNGYVDDLAYPSRPSGPAAPVGGHPPPLPPRRRPVSSYVGSPSGFGGVGAGMFGGGYMSPFGGGLYNGGPYSSPYSAYRTPYDSRYGYGEDDGPFSPFQSVESVVRAISSLSMMMESTYQSMYMSFRAVLGVAENMERLRRIVIDVFGSVAIFKSVVWFCKKILYIMGLIRNNPARESLWEAAAAEVVNGAATAGGRPPGRSWPLVAFFGLMLGGPYVLYKLAAPKDAPDEVWDMRKDGVKCLALYDFDTNQRGELSFRRGEVLVRKRSAQVGWVMAAKQNGQMGLVPADRLKPINELQPYMLKEQKESPGRGSHTYPKQMTSTSIKANSTENTGTNHGDALRKNPPENVDAAPSETIIPAPSNPIITETEFDENQYY